MNYFICTSHHFTPQGRYELNKKLTSLPLCGFIAQLVEHRTGIAEVTGSNPVEALSFSACLNWTIYCDDHNSSPVRSDCLGKTRSSWIPWENGKQWYSGKENTTIIPVH